LDAFSLAVRHGSFDGDWCWLVAGAATHWVYTVFYAPLWLVQLYICYVVVACRWKFRQHAQQIANLDGDRRASERYDQACEMYSYLAGREMPFEDCRPSETPVPSARLKRRSRYPFAGYPFVLLITWIVGSFRRAWLSVEPGGLSIEWAWVHNATASLGGFFNAAYFVFSHPQGGARMAAQSDPLT
jgi:hypothetical protein